VTFGGLVSHIDQVGGLVIAAVDALDAVLRAQAALASNRK
jgi:hypothetical protein